MTSRLLATTAILICFSSISANAVAAEHWITAPADDTVKPGEARSLQFRKTIDLPRPAKSLRVRVSADSRYILYVNGRRFAAGPSRGDLGHWRIETIDIAPGLRAGRNVLAAQVWNDGKAAPIAQISSGRTAFTLDAVDPRQSQVNTASGWLVRIDRSREVRSGYTQIGPLVGFQNYYAAGGAERLDGTRRDWGWLGARADGSDWQIAAPALKPSEAAPWTIVPDTLPAQRYQVVPSGKVVSARGVSASGFPNAAFTVPANSEASVIVDAGRVLAAYPELVVSGGQGSQIELTYTEALYGPGKRRLADRSATVGQVLGLTDTVVPDGGTDRTFSPYWWRSWRFVQLKVKTGDRPVTLERFITHETGYPFDQVGRFESDDPELNRIWQIGWKTALVDAHETYMDTAYWEQLQYIGDTRLQALISYAVSGDARLADQALGAFDDSRIVDGLPQAAWPASNQNSIPPFALLWIGMLHDHWMWRPDTTPVKAHLAGMRSVLAWFEGHIDADDMLANVPGWLFVDWRPGLNGRPPGRPESNPGSCLIGLHYLGALQQAAQLENALGDKNRSADDGSKAERLARAIRTRCWDAERGVFVDDPARRKVSQHTNALAIIYDVASKNERVGIIDRVLLRNDGIAAPQGVTSTTYYFSYYLARALEHAGLADRYPEFLKTWRSLLTQNFTTWPEEPDPTRSDSHAWSAHPTLDLMTLMAGVRPAAPGFERVAVEPHLGALRKLRTTMAHPAGPIDVIYDLDAGSAKVTLPGTLTGEFVWKGRRTALRPGRNTIRIN